MIKDRLMKVVVWAVIIPAGILTAGEGPRISLIALGDITTSSAVIHWTTDIPSDSQVDYGTTPSYGLSTPLDPALVTQHSRCLTGLSEGTVYHYRVKSRDAAGNLSSTWDYTFTTVVPPRRDPPVISAVAAAGVTASGAVIFWKTDVPSDSQVDYGTTVSYGASSELESNPVTVHSVELTGLSAGTVYHFQAKSRAAAGVVGVSPDFTFTTAEGPPNIIGVTASEITASGVTISWTTDIPADSQVTYGETEGCEEESLLDGTLVRNHLQQLTGLRLGTTYYFRVRSRSAGGNLAVSVTESFLTAAESYITLVVPRIGIAAGREAEGDTARATGIALVNEGDAEAELTFTAYDSSGLMIAGGGIMNPAVRTLTPGEQFLGTDFELFGTGIQQQQASGWIEIRSTGDGVTGFALTYDSALSMMDGAPLSAVPTLQSVFAGLEVEGFTILHVANPNEVAANVTFVLVASDGSSKSLAFRTIEAMGATADSVAALFSDAVPEASDSVFLLSDVGVVPSALLGTASKDIASVSGLDQNSGSTVLYCPQYAVGSLFRTTLSIINLEEYEGTLTVRLFSDNGAQMGPEKTVPIAAYGTAHIADPSFFDVPPGEDFSGYAVIESSGPVIAGNAVFGDPSRDSFLTALPLVSHLEHSMVFSQYASDRTFFTGLALLNPGDADAMATIELYRPDGGRENAVTLTLPARSKLSKTLTEILPSLAGQDRSSGYIRVVTDQYVAGFCVFGTHDLRVLSAVPGQIAR